MMCVRMSLLMAKQSVKLTAAVVVAIFLVAFIVSVSYVIIPNQNLPLVSPYRHYLNIRTSVPLTQVVIGNDGTVSPSNAGIVRNGDIYLLTDTVVNCTIEVQKDNIVIDGAGHSFIASVDEGTGFGEQAITFHDRNNVNIRNIVFKKYSTCIVASNSSGITIAHNIMGNGGLVGLLLDNCNYTTITDNTINDVSQAIMINSQTPIQSTNCTIARNIITNAASGVHIHSGKFADVVENTFEFVNNPIWFSSNYTMVSGNIMHNGIDGIGVGGKYSVNSEKCSGGSHSVIRGNLVDNFTHSGIYFNIGIKNTIFENTIINCKYGVGININGDPDGSWLVEDNIFFHNNFVNNTEDVLAETNSTNYWDNGSEGNYWDKLTGVDNNRDGINDTPYNIAVNSVDRYPLINRYGNLGFNQTLSSQIFVRYIVIGLAVTLAVMIGGAIYYKKRVKR